MPGMMPKKKSPDEIEREFEVLRERHNESLVIWLKTHSQDAKDHAESRATPQAIGEP